MKFQSLHVMFHSSLLSLLINCNFSTGQETKTAPSVCSKELSFGIEFTLDNVISSVTLANGSTYGLAKVSGGVEYQSLMRKYLTVAHDVYLTQKPPTDRKRSKLAKAISEEHFRRNRFIRNPDSWWDYVVMRVFRRPEFSPEVFEGDEYSGNVEVDILAKTVEVAKHETFLQLHHEFNVSSDAFRWPYASIVTPDFL